MARLRRQIKEEILTRQKMPQGITATNIGNVDGDPISNVRYIRRVAAIFGDHAVDQQNLDAERDETPRDGRADKVLRFFADRAAKKWPLRGSLKLGIECL